MRPTFFLRTLRTALVGCVLLGFSAVTTSMVLSRRYDDAHPKGLHLVYQMLLEEPVARRAERLAELQEHFTVDYQLQSRTTVERRLGRTLPRTLVRDTVPVAVDWYYLAFEDAPVVLVAGPVHPRVPHNQEPWVLFLILLALPVLATVLTMDVNRALSNVERASRDLADGKLGTRVQPADGASLELATSFNHMAERIERLVRSRDELVQAISHELGSPLSRIRFHLELLETEDAEAHTRRLETLREELESLEALVAELLTYVQSDESALDICTFDPGDGLSHLAELAAFDVEDGRSIDVEVSHTGDAVFADRRLFQRAVENLLRNAVRHAHTQVRVETVASAEGVYVAVHDDGPGIPETLRTKVMQPFVRLEVDRGRHTGGVGLGLAIVSRIVERHGGRIEIQTSRLGGAVVKTWWPHSRAT